MRLIIRFPSEYHLVHQCDANHKSDETPQDPSALIELVLYHLCLSHQGLQWFSGCEEGLYIDVVRIVHHIWI